MSAEDNARLAREIHQEFNDRDYDRADDLVSPDPEWDNAATGETFSGPEGVKQFQRGWSDAISDAKMEIQEVHAGDDFAVN
jgi:ketosteroid isomerase-like protein